LGLLTLDMPTGRRTGDPAEADSFGAALADGDGSAFSARLTASQLKTDETASEPSPNATT